MQVSFPFIISVSISTYFSEVVNGSWKQRVQTKHSALPQPIATFDWNGKVRRMAPVKFDYKDDVNAFLYCVIEIYQWLGTDELIEEHLKFSPERKKFKMNLFITCKICERNDPIKEND